MCSSDLPTFTFKLAYAQKNSSQNDYLKVFVSTNCGVSWSQRYSKSGSQLQTLGTGVYQSAAFTPNANQWRTETINVNNIASLNNVRFKFVFMCDSATAGNNIYIDDINIVSTSGVGIDDVLENTLNYYLAPNPGQGNSQVKFYLENPAPVKISVTDMTGRNVEVVDVGNCSPGDYNLRIGNNLNYAHGIYFVNLQVGEKTFTRKLLID